MCGRLLFGATPDCAACFHRDHKTPVAQLAAAKAAEAKKASDAKYSANANAAKAKATATAAAAAAAAKTSDEVPVLKHNYTVASVPKPKCSKCQRGAKKLYGTLCGWCTNRCQHLSRNRIDPCDKPIADDMLFCAEHLNYRRAVELTAFCATTDCVGKVSPYAPPNSTECPACVRKRKETEHANQTAADQQQIDPQTGQFQSNDQLVAAASALAALALSGHDGAK